MKKYLFLCAGIILCNLITPSDVSAQSKKAQKKLKRLCRNRSPKKVRPAIASGIDVNAVVDKRGTTCFIMAAKYNKHPESIKLFAESGADLSATDNAGNTASICLARNLRPRNNLLLLVEIGLDVNAKSVHNPSSANDVFEWPVIMHDLVLMELRSAENISQLKALLKVKNINVNATDNTGRTALMYAADIGLPETTALLLENGADANAKDKAGQTALMYATQAETKSFLSTSDIKKPSDLKKTSNLEGLFRRRGGFIFRNFIKSSMSTEYARFRWAYEREERRHQVISQLIDAGGDINHKNDGGQTPLMVACGVPLISANITKSTYKGEKTDEDNEPKSRKLNMDPVNQIFLRTFLGEAIRAGMDINAKDINGNTALIHATNYTSNSNNLRYLLRAGADANAVNNAGENAMKFLNGRIAGAVVVGIIDGLLNRLFKDNRPVSDTDTGPGAVFYVHAKLLLSKYMKK